MSSAFDTLRLEGKRAPLSAEYATIPTAEITRFPHADGAGCKQLQITPTDWSLPNPLPSGLQPAARYDAGDTGGGRMDTVVRAWILALAAIFVCGVARAADTSPTLSRVRAAGLLRCGIDTAQAEYSTSDDHGNRAAFDADLCRAVAVAVLGEECADERRALSRRPRRNARARAG